MPAYEISKEVFNNYMDEILDVVESEEWVFVIKDSKTRFRLAAIMPYRRYWNTLDDGK